MSKVLAVLILVSLSTGCAPTQRALMAEDSGELRRSDGSTMRCATEQPSGSRVRQRVCRPVEENPATQRLAADSLLLNRPGVSSGGPTQQLR